MRYLVAVTLILFAACDTASFRLSDPDVSLQELVAEMLPDLERLSGLVAKGPVNVARQTTAEARAYIEQRLDMYLPPDRLEGLRRSYVMLGLLPDTLDLRRLILELYGEQVAGFYDPLTTTLYVVDGVPAASVDPVLAHELVHALQDQHENIDSLITRPGENDRQTAAQSAIEGHATLTMFAWLAESTSGQQVDPATLPDPAASVGAGFAESDQSRVFRRAPRILQETLLFPYAQGASFVLAVWRQPSIGRVAPFGALMPRSTEQVAYPLERFVEQPDEPTDLRFEPAAGWTVAYENTLGALETGIFIEEALGPMTDAARGWDGDRYILLEAGASSVLLWTSIWDDEGAADLFAERVRRALDQPRVPNNGTVARMLLYGRPAVHVRIGDAAALTRTDFPPAYCVSESGERRPCDGP